MKNPDWKYTANLLKRRWLSSKSFEIIISRPEGFIFDPGQRISLNLGEYEREYSVVSAPNETNLTLCIRNVTGGRVSDFLSTAEMGAPLTLDGPHGYFTYKPSVRTAIFVATGTGVAPFCSMAGAGTAGFTILHGVRSHRDLYYSDRFKRSARTYVPCLTDSEKMPSNAFQGKVTAYLSRHLPPASYDFYLCGRSEMIRDVTHLVDDRFPDSLVYTEMFY